MAVCFRLCSSVACPSGWRPRINLSVSVESPAGHIAFLSTDKVLQEDRGRGVWRTLPTQMGTLLGECSPICPGELLRGLERGILRREGTGLPGQGRNILKRPCLICTAAVGFSGYICMSEGITLMQYSGGWSAQAHTRE